MQIDSKDKMILSLLARDPHLSQGEIAKKVGLAQPSVAVRIEKLKRNHIMQTQIGINPLKVGLTIAKVDISTNDPASFLEMFVHCPHFINGYTVSGNYNVCLFFISDNFKALESLVNCHIRSSEAVKYVSFNLITDAKKNFIVPIKFINKTNDGPQCGTEKICIGCKNFIAENCMKLEDEGMLH